MSGTLTETVTISLERYHELIDCWESKKEYRIYGNQFYREPRYFSSNELADRMVKERDEYARMIKDIENLDCKIGYRRKVLALLGKVR